MSTLRPADQAIGQQLTTVRVGIVSKTFFYVPVWAAIQLRLFEQHGLNVELSILGNQSQTDPLLNDRMDIAIATPEAAIQNAAQGGPLRIIAGNTGKLSHSLISRPQFAKIEDLRGGTIGVLNMLEGSFFQIKEMLSQHNLHYPEDYQVKETGGVPPRHQALLNGTIDAGLQSIPWNYLAEDAGLRNHGDVVSYIPDWQFVSINSNVIWAEKNRATVVQFLIALMLATNWVYENREQSAAVAERELPTTLEYARRAWDYYTSTNALTRDMSVSVDGLTKVIQTQLTAGLLGDSASREMQHYVDTRFIEEARSLLP